MREAARRGTGQVSADSAQWAVCALQVVMIGLSDLGSGLWREKLIKPAS